MSNGGSFCRICGQGVPEGSYDISVAACYRCADELYGTRKVGELTIDSAPSLNLSEYYDDGGFSV